MIKVLLAVFLSTLVVGCSSQAVSDSEEPEVRSEDTDKQQKEINQSASDSQYVNNPQAPDDRSLQKAGQTYEDLDGKITLKAINEVNKAHMIGPIELTIKSIKVFNYYPSPDLIDFFHEFTSNENNFNYVKLEVAILNTSGDQLNFSPVSYIETNMGEKKSWEDDFYMEGLYGIIKGTQRKQGSLGFILDETQISELKSIKIVTSPVFNDKKDIIQQEKEITVELQ